jgi:hypothetical protein
MLNNLIMEAKNKKARTRGSGLIDQELVAGGLQCTKPALILPVRYELTSSVAA